MAQIRPEDFQPIVPRARLGFIIPSSNRMVEPQMARYAPADVAVHFQRIGMTNRHKAPLDQLLPRITYAAEMLGDSKCSVTVLQCTGTSMSGGVDKEKEVIGEIEKTTGKPSLSAASSLLAAFEALEARKLVFISETDQAGHDKKKAFLAEAGLEIVADRAAGLAGTDAYCTTPPEFWYQFAMAMRNDSADAYFLSCANIHSIDVIERLEAILNRPVVTSNQAALWCALRTAGLRDDIPALGRLLKCDLSANARAAE
ncbi:MAG: hypothetical protein RLZ98_3512 [Pseudomonadota bacterium]|jgi:maleate isomerase